MRSFGRIISLFLIAHAVVMETRADWQVLQPDAPLVDLATVPSVAVTPLPTIATYDGGGNRLSQLDANGALTTFAYDRAGALTNAVRHLSSGESAAFFSATYDAQGRNLLRKNRAMRMNQTCVSSCAGDNLTSQSQSLLPSGNAEMTIER